MGRRTPYSEEFKQEAVKLVRVQGLRPAQAARDLGVGADTLRRWLDETAPSRTKGYAAVWWFAQSCSVVPPVN
jgi:transposase-like protein